MRFIRNKLLSIADFVNPLLRPSIQGVYVVPRFIVQVVHIIPGQALRHQA